MGGSLANRAGDITPGVTHVKPGAAQPGSGIGLVLVAMVMWDVLAVLMLSSYGPDASSWDSAAEPRCKGPPLAPFQRDSSVCHSELRQWPALLGLLALAVIPTIIAAAVAVYAKLLSRMATALGGAHR